MSTQTQKESETFENIQELLVELKTMIEYGSRSIDIEYIVAKIEDLRASSLRDAMKVK